MPLPVEGHNFGPRSDVDRWSFLDPTHQISGHVRRDAVGPDEQVHSSTGAREKHRRLASRVGAPGDDNLITVAQLRFFHKCRVVIDAGTFELFDIGKWRLTVS